MYGSFVEKFNQSEYKTLVRSIVGNIKFREISREIDRNQDNPIEI